MTVREMSFGELQQNAAKYRVDPSRLVLIGESAGGQLVSWLGVTQSRELGIRAVVPLYGPHDLLARAEAVERLANERRAVLEHAQTVERALAEEVLRLQPEHRALLPQIVVVRVRVGNQRLVGEEINGGEVGHVCVYPPSGLIAVHLLSMA